MQKKLSTEEQRARKKETDHLRFEKIKISQKRTEEQKARKKETDRLRYENIKKFKMIMCKKKYPADNIVCVKQNQNRSESLN